MFLISAGLAIILAAVLGLSHPAGPQSGFWGTFSYVSVCSCGILIGLFAVLVPAL